MVALFRFCKLDFANAHFIGVDHPSEALARHIGAYGSATCEPWQCIVSLIHSCCYLLCNRTNNAPSRKFAFISEIIQCILSQNGNFI